MTAEVNGIVIGILAGILALVLLCIAYAATSSWRKKVCKYKKRSDPYQSRKKGCWETLFGYVNELISHFYSEVPIKLSIIDSLNS